MKPVISVLNAHLQLRGPHSTIYLCAAGGDQRRARNYTLPLALRGIGNTFGWLDYSKVMAGSSTYPDSLRSIVFFIFQRNLVKGIALTGIKELIRGKGRKAARYPRCSGVKLESSYREVQWAKR